MAFRVDLHQSGPSSTERGELSRSWASDAPSADPRVSSLRTVTGADHLRLGVTVIIPCRGMTTELRECLASLERLAPAPDEVLVLPDEPVYEVFPRTRFLPTGPCSPPEKRDRALSESRGDVLVFLDDDAYPRSDWLRNVLPHFTDPTVAAVGGPAMTPSDDPLWAQVSGAVFSSWLGSGPARMRYHPVGRLREIDDWPSVNLLVRRSAFADVGGFGTSFWPGEDTKLCLELCRRGFRILYDPQVVVYHHRATTPLRHLRQVARYGLHRGYFVRAFPDTSRRWPYFLPLGAFLAAVLVLVGAVVSPGLRVPVSVLALLVGATAVVASIVEAYRIRRPLVAILYPPVLVLTHGTYALAFLRGLLSNRLKQYGRGSR